MKLKDFTQDADLNHLRRAMKAELTSWSSSVAWQKVELEDALTAYQGLVIPFNSVVIEDDKTFTLNGRKILVYIRDQDPKYYAEGYKFHVANCKTVLKYQNDGRSRKYVASSRRDGVFVVNLMLDGKVIESEKLEKLKVCKNCLEALNYKGYNHEPNRNASVDNFSIEIFFQLYTHQNITIPEHTDITSRLNKYPKDWNSILKSYRQKKNWTCENCGRNLRGEMQYLDVHHISGHKDYNRDADLRALCVRCHSEEPGHGHMTQLPKYQEFVRKYPAQRRF